MNTTNKITKAYPTQQIIEWHSTVAYIPAGEVRVLLFVQSYDNEENHDYEIGIYSKETDEYLNMSGNEIDGHPTHWAYIIEPDGFPE